MIYSALYKIRILKAQKQLYNLWGPELIKLQEKYIKTIERMFWRWYKKVLSDLESNTELKYNDIFIDQKQFINKEVSNKDLDEYGTMMSDGFKIGAKQLNKSFKKDIRVDTTFSVDPWDALKYSNEYAGSRISGIDEYSKKRINNLVSTGLEKGWWYNKLAEELKRDFSFSSYRANLIASQEIGEAYLNWKDRQFAKYTREYGQKGWKHWVSHRDDKTTEGCLGNDNAGWIPYDQEFPSGHMKPTRFVGCRCNCVYRLFDPRQDGEVLDINNASWADQEQSLIPEDGDWQDDIKPEWYDTYSTGVLPARYFNAIGEKATYIKPKGRAYYSRVWNVINIGKGNTSEYVKKATEVHEVGHFFFTRAVLNNEERFWKFKKIFEDSVGEVKKLISDATMKSRFSTKHYTVEIAEKLLEDFSDIRSIKAYSIKTETAIHKSWREWQKKVMSDELGEDLLAFMDTLWALTKEEVVGWGHWKSYYRRSKDIFWMRHVRISEMQVQEYFAHLNEVHWLWNPFIEKFLPETHKAMKQYYKDIWFDFIQ